MKRYSISVGTVIKTSHGIEGWSLYDTIYETNSYKKALKFIENRLLTETIINDVYDLENNHKATNIILIDNFEHDDHKELSYYLEFE